MDKRLDQIHMSGAKIINFMTASQMLTHYEDGRCIEDTLAGYGWDLDSELDTYKFFEYLDTSAQLEVVQTLCEQFPQLNYREQDVLLGMIFWHTEDWVFYHLVETNQKLQYLLRLLFAGEDALRLVMENYGCGSRKYRSRVHYCAELVASDFVFREDDLLPES